MADYVTADRFRAFIHDPSALDTSVIEQVITAASREVDKDCGRFFSADTSATAHTFSTTNAFHCDLDCAWDIWTTSGLIVKTDTNGDGTYDATWTINSDFILEPVNQINAGIRGWPYESIRAISSRQFPVSSYIQPYPIQVTAKWGWAAVPDGIVTATLFMANAMYKRGDAPFGIAGFDALGAVRVRSDPMYLSVISPFIRTKQLVA